MLLDNIGMHVIDFQMLHVVRGDAMGDALDLKKIAFYTHSTQ
jgi:hypothetical protein